MVEAASPQLLRGRYRLGSVLGEGGFGKVWRAMDELIGRAVAVKELRPPSGLPVDEKALLGRRALREARTAGQISHPGVVAIHDVLPATEDDDAVYVVMELVEAPSLAQVLERDGRLPEGRVAALAVGIFDALAAAHRIGVVHRDVKPGNILVLPGDRVKLVDFGIAHAVDETRLTRDGVTGSTAYMAPELFHGEDPTLAADLWSVGATLFHALAGRGPFDHPAAAAVVHAVLYAEIPAPPCGGPLGRVVAGCLVRDPGRRLTAQQALALLGSDVTVPQAPGTGPAVPHRPATVAATAPHGPAPSRVKLPMVFAIVGLVVALVVVLAIANPGDKKTPVPVATLGALPGAVALGGTEVTQAATFSPDGRLLVTAVESAVQFWDLADPGHPRPAGRIPRPELGKQPYFELAAFRPDGRVLAVTDELDETVQLWSTADPAHPAQLGQLSARELPCCAIDALAFSPDGRTLAVTRSGEVQLWTVADPAHPAKLGSSVKLAGVASAKLMAFGPDGRTLVAGQQDVGPVLVLDVANPAHITPLSSSDEDGLTAVAVRPDGRGFALGKSGSVQLWTAPVRTAGPAQRHQYGPVSLAFGAGGRVLALTANTGTVGLWDVPDGGEPAFKGEAKLPGTDKLDGLVLGPDGHTAVTVTRDSLALSLLRIG
ncbi:WD40 repeat domain-containing serine/threonine protein kinase [Amycolatopsis sp. MtRt-6]|uniref:WD40 repeat domain-containing serine/threonine protein kinase n=1 Tax=Amycolatopsis sp. MtRt-6 TaxID=2792782 RepID=UPI001A90BD9B|nr:WD40 repeat domain-containing serine/threonine protein kinase [Amycolatopsis sp. MtRt-6]